MGGHEKIRKKCSIPTSRLTFTFASNLVVLRCIDKHANKKSLKCLRCETDYAMFSWVDDWWKKVFWYHLKCIKWIRISDIFVGKHFVNWTGMRNGCFQVCWSRAEAALSSFCKLNYPSILSWEWKKKCNKNTSNMELSSSWFESNCMSLKKAFGH